MLSYIFLHISYIFPILFLYISCIFPIVPYIFPIFSYISSCLRPSPPPCLGKITGPQNIDHKYLKTYQKLTTSPQNICQKCIQNLSKIDKKSVPKALLEGSWRLLGGSWGALGGIPLGDLLAPDLRFWPTTRLLSWPKITKIT